MFCLFSTSWRSGAGWFTRELALGLAQVGANVTFIAPLGEGFDPTLHHDLIERRLLPRVESTNAHFFTRRSFTVVRTFSAAYELLRVRPKTRVFFLNFVSSITFVIGFAIFLRLTGARVVFITHDPTPHKWASPLSLRRFEIYMHKVAYLSVSHIVCLSSQSKKALEDTYRVASEKISIIPHGVFDIGAIPRTPGPRTLLLFGTLRRNKSIRESIEAVSRLRSEGTNVRLKIAGGIHAEDSLYVTECLEWAKARPEGFEFDLRYIADKELPSLIASVEAFLLPYGEFNSQSGVGVLAAVSGRPIIASSSGGLPELFSDGAAGVAISMPVTVESIAAAIRAYLLVEPEKWQADGLRGRERLLSNHSWTRIAKEYANLADKLDRANKFAHE